MAYLARLIVALLFFSALPAFSATVAQRNVFAGVMRVRGPSGVIRTFRDISQDPFFAAGAGADVVASRQVGIDLAGAAEAVVTEAGTITALDVAKGAVGLLRGGLLPAAISVALPVVLEAIHANWTGSGFTISNPAGDPSGGVIPMPAVSDRTLHGDSFEGSCSAAPGTMMWQNNGTQLAIQEMFSSNPGSPWQVSYYCNSTHWRMVLYVPYTFCAAGSFYNVGTGACASDYQQPATDDDVENDMAGNMGTNGPTIAQGVYDNGGSMNSGDPSASGPSTVPGPTSTSSTTTDAGTTTTTTHTDYGITYNGDQVTVTPTTTTTTTTPDGKQSVTTETDTPATSGGQTPPSPPADQKVNCDKYPSASGCEPLGTPDDVALPTQSINIGLSPTLTAAGSCPAPLSFTALGRSYSISFEYICGLATGVRPIVIALAWLSAGFFIFMIARG